MSPPSPNHLKCMYINFSFLLSITEQIFFLGEFSFCVVTSESERQTIEPTEVTKFSHKPNLDEMSFMENSGN